MGGGSKIMVLVKQNCAKMRTSNLSIKQTSIACFISVQSSNTLTNIFI